MAQSARHILVFGSAGTGKTSFVNALTGANNATGSGASGVTLESKVVSASRDGIDYRIIDTVGLNESEGGAVESKQAVEALGTLLDRTRGGLNLMIMVVEKGRIHAQTQNNYKLFVETMTGKMVPLLIVVTHCEREKEDMQGWVQRNRTEFLARGMKAEQIVGTTFVSPDPEFDNVEVINRKVRKSVQLSWGAIRAHSTQQRVDFVRLNGGGKVKLVRNMYNSVVSFFGASGMVWVDNDVVNLLQRVGNITRAEATKLAKRYS